MFIICLFHKTKLTNKQEKEETKKSLKPHIMDRLNKSRFKTYFAMSRYFLVVSLPQIGQPILLPFLDSLTFTLSLYEERNLNPKYISTVILLQPSCCPDVMSIYKAHTEWVIWFLLIFLVIHIFDHYCCPKVMVKIIEHQSIKKYTYRNKTVWEINM